MSDTPQFMTIDSELEAQVDLSDLGWGSFHLVDPPFHHVNEAFNQKGVMSTALTIRAYCGPDSDSGEGNDDWPEKNAAKKDWLAFVNGLPTKVVWRINSAVAKFSGLDDKNDEAGN